MADVGESSSMDETLGSNLEYQWQKVLEFVWR